MAASGIQIRGTAHPPPPASGRHNPADLTRGEIATTKMSNRPLLFEHDAGDRIGTVLASWPGADGSLRICANVNEPRAVESIRNGSTRGLSLGTDLVLSEKGDVLYRTQNELSVCVEGKRENTRIDTIDGKSNNTVPTQHAEEPRGAMAETAPAITEAPGVAESNRDDLVQRLKAELAEKTAAEAAANARASAYEKKERHTLSTYQPEAQWLLKDWLVKEAEEYHAGTSLGSDIAPLAVWADEYINKKDINSQGALAAMSYVASKGVKRLREEASKGAAASEALAASLKENEELKANLAKVARDRDDAIETATERQKGLAAMEAQLQQAGLVSPWDFSKSTSREASADASSTAAAQRPVAEPHAALTSPALVEVQAQASKAAAAASGPRANPLEASGDLLTTLLSRANGGLKMESSGTAHALLGAQNGDADISSILRMTA